MPDPAGLAAAAAAGSGSALAVLSALTPENRLGARHWLVRRARPMPTSMGGLRRLESRLKQPASGGQALGWLRALLAQSGRTESGAELLAITGLATVLVATGAAVGAAVLASAAAAGPVVAVALLLVPALVFGRLRAAAAKRRARLNAELAPLLELVCLEVSGGAAPPAALESVLVRSDCELAQVLRTELVLSRLAGSATFEARLTSLAGAWRLPALDSLALALSLSRDYGSGVGQGLRALASDLRRVQRRALIASSRRALNRVLLPAAVGVLLPFMAILLYPALATLAVSFR